ncbi:unnamed protein product [Closterium sp. NIES-65]|nr:unnamed protein product [Closterium sp. NIES-65]
MPPSPGPTQPSRGKHYGPVQNPRRRARCLCSREIRPLRKRLPRRKGLKRSSGMTPSNTHSVGAAGQRGTPVHSLRQPAHPAEAGPDVDMRTLPVDDRNSSQSHREPLPDTKAGIPFDRLIDMMIALSEKVQKCLTTRGGASFCFCWREEVAKPATENLGSHSRHSTASEAASAAAKSHPSLPQRGGLGCAYQQLRSRTTPSLEAGAGAADLMEARGLDQVTPARPGGYQQKNSRVRENKARVDDRYGSADTLARTRRCIKFGELAELSRAAEALIAADLAPTTDETRKSLEEKHPAPRSPSQQRTAAAPFLTRRNPRSSSKRGCGAGGGAVVDLEFASGFGETRWRLSARSQWGKSLPRSWPDGRKSILGVEDSEAPFPPIFEEAESALKRLPEKVRTKLPTWKTVGERGLERGTFTVLARELQIEALNGIRKSLNRPRHKARLTSLQLQNAGAWVSALPSRPDLQLESDDWAIAANLRLGRDIPHLIQAGTCSCGKDLSTCNAAGHALRCSTKYAPSIPHNAIRDHVAMVCREAGMQTTMEDKAFFGGKPIPDVVSLHTDSGKTWVMDVVIADPHDNNANCPETKPGAALNEAVRRKKVTYKEAVTKGGKRMEKTTK